MFVDQYLDNVFLKRFENATKAGEELCINRHHISGVCRGERKTAGGFTFKYSHGEDLPEEEWKEVEGIMVSNLGRVYKVGKSRKSYGHLNSQGYYTTQFKRDQFLVHRLVMQAFHQKSSLHVDHIDGDKENNNLTNLRYTTQSENNKNRKRPEKRKHCKTCVCQIK